MDEFSSEKEQIDELRQWWAENGRWVMAGLILGLGALGGWRYWTAYQDARAAAASAQYSELLVAVAQQDRDAALELGRLLQEEYDDTPYAAQSALALSKMHVEGGEPEDALYQLREAMELSDDPGLTHVVRLRLARVLLDQEDLDAALALLDVTDEGGFKPRYHEVRGDVQLARGDAAAARKEYQRALAASQPGIVDRALLQMKLDDLNDPSIAGAASGETDSTSGEPAS